jgi:hypothetical protein
MPVLANDARAHGQVIMAVTWGNIISAWWKCEAEATAYAGELNT